MTTGFSNPSFDTRIGALAAAEGQARRQTTGTQNPWGIGARGLGYEDQNIIETHDEIMVRTCLLYRFVVDRDFASKAVRLEIRGFGFTMDESELRNLMRRCSNEMYRFAKPRRHERERFVCLPPLESIDEAIAVPKLSDRSCPIAKMKSEIKAWLSDAL